MAMRRRTIGGVAVAIALAVVVLAVSLLDRQGGTQLERGDTDGELLEAIRTGDIAALAAYLSSGGSPDRRIDVFGRSMSLLRTAVIDREEEIALRLLDAGVDPESSDVSLQEVGRNGLSRLLDRMLAMQPVESEPVSYTGIIDAALNGYYDTVQVYLSYATDRDAWASELNGAFGGALIAGYDDVARLLVERDSPLDEGLHVAARFSSPGVIRYLLSEGLTVDAALVLPPEEADQPQRAIEFAWRRYQEESAFFGALPADSHVHWFRNDDASYVLFELMRVGSSLDAVSMDAPRDGLREMAGLAGAERLVYAARAGFYDVAEETLSTAFQYLPQDLRSALMMALRKDHDDIARLLIRSGAPVDGGPLHVASAASSPGMVRFLIGQGADPNERYEGRSPLEFWLERNVTEDPELILHELVSAGADACWLVAFQDELPGLSVDVLRHSAPACW